MAYIIHGPADVKNLPRFMDSRRRPTSEILPYLMGQPTSAEIGGQSPKVFIKEM
jgi:hypothetical protein